MTDHYQSYWAPTTTGSQPNTFRSAETGPDPAETVTFAPPPAAPARRPRTALRVAMPETGEWHEVRSPYSGEPVARVPEAGADHARQAVDAAERAMQEPMPAHKRAEILDGVAALLRERHDEVAGTISAEAGKPMKAARVEAERAVSTFTMAAAEAPKAKATGK